MMASKADYNRATLITINDTFYPTIENLNFVDYDDAELPSTEFIPEELYEGKIWYDQSTGGIRFPPEV